MSRYLLSGQARRSTYIEHDLPRPLHGDIKAGFKAHRIAREISAYSTNIVRRRENDPSIAGSGVCCMPTNWFHFGDSPTHPGAA